MKKIILLLFIASTLQSQNQQPQARIVTGNLIYSGYDYTPGEQTVLKLNGVSITVNVDSINDKQIRLLLNKAGIKDSLILFTKGFGSSILNRIECFFAFEGVMPVPRIDFCTQNSHELSCSYAVQDGLIVPQYLNINDALLQKVVVFIAQRYPITTFMVKPFSFDLLPFYVLIRYIQNGTLADMRNINCSERLVDYFIDLNYQIIWYKTCDGKIKNLMRPKTGWKPRA